MTLRAALQMCRIPNVFTALANVAAGVLLARGGELAVADLRLLGASALLYCAGMVLNDFFDREVDARERPERPIPSGQVSPAAAAILGFAMLAGGVALAAWAGPAAGTVALALAAAILLYDAVLKGTALGPLSMGSCRSLNVCLGLSVAHGSLSSWAWAAPVALGLYTAAITYLARDEVGGSTQGRTRLGVLMLAGLFGSFVLLLATIAPARDFPAVAAALPFVLFLAVRGRALFRPLLHDPSPNLIGRAIGGGILLMPVIDAAFVAASGHFIAALAVVALAAPAYALKRWYYMT